MIDLIKFFQPAYLFDVRPYTTGGTIRTMVIFFAIFLIIGLGLKIFEKFRKLEKFQTKILSKSAALFITLGAIGLGLTWIRYERVQLLSSRYWLLVWLMILIVWLYPIVSYWLKTAPEAKKRNEEKKLFRKYLPNKK
ncbi:MAG: hypothetical protein WC517_02130 [Patescibacteria group bacterium]